MSVPTPESFIAGFHNHDIYCADILPRVNYAVPVNKSLGQHAVWGGEGLAVIRTAPQGSLAEADEFLIVKPDDETFDKLARELDIRPDYINILVNYDPSGDLLLMHGLAANLVSLLKPGEVHGAIGRSGVMYDRSSGDSHLNTSREHFSLYYRGEDVLVRDLGSTNGTRVHAAEMPYRWSTFEDATTE